MMLGPTEVAGSRSWHLGGYHLVFYPDLANAFRSASQPSLFHWLPDRLHLARETDRYSFEFTRYHREPTPEDSVCGAVRFTLGTVIPEDILNETTRNFLASCPKNDPYWGWISHTPANFLPLTYQYTHTTLSNIAARSERVARLVGVDPWYCEKQGDEAGPMSATDSRAYTTLLGTYYTQLFQRAVVEGDDSLMVNRTVGLEFGAPITRLVFGGARGAVGEALLAEAASLGRGDGRDITWDGVRNAGRKLLAEGALSVECELDERVPDGETYRQRLLEETGFLDGVFLDLARESVLMAPASRPTALSEDEDGPPNPWGASWRVAEETGDGARASLKVVLVGVNRYLRPVSVPTSFANEFTEIRREPARYFLDRYPESENQDLSRVFRPVLAHDNPVVSALTVSCGYPDASGELVYQAHVFPKAEQPGEEPQLWNYRTTMRSAQEVPHPPPGWTPDRTFVRRAVLLSTDNVNTELVIAQVDSAQLDIDPDPGGSLLNDIAIDVSPRMLPYLDVYPLVLQPGLRTGEKLTADFEALSADGIPLENYRASFSWSDKEDNRPRRWLIYSSARDFAARYRYRVTLQGLENDGTPGPWINACGSWSLHIRIPRGTAEAVA
ncbi:hypothetical protein [Streptomyces profundus]|uniref:hypothetical protein n=1 Tax=Streptomyces profundus TaxID=2867410 RepID=UPI001D16E7E1|nr:hypothetical protein [Streptomyces sp. MA3_2.13]UED86599.1 hypothetical protein K4G22_22370 [Streptomyces sp. MA3_2.13]